MVYSVSTGFQEVEEVYEFLDDIDAENYRITGSMTIPGRELSEMEDMDLGEIQRELEAAPRTSYKVSLSYNEPEVAVTAKVGPFPQITVEADRRVFDTFEQYEKFVEEQNLT